MVKPSNAPQSIATARLNLRRPVAADIDAMFARYASDPAVTRYLAWPTHQTRADTEAFLGYCDSEWETSPSGTYLIIGKDDGRLLGSTGLSFPTATETITGYVLARDVWGRGLATETLTAMVELALSLGATRVSAGSHVDNLASRRVLAKCGFEHGERYTQPTGFPNLAAEESHDLLLYSRRLTG